MKMLSLIIIFLTLSLSVSAVIISDSANADSSQGTENDPVPCCNMVMYIPNLTDIWLYEGGSVDITFSEIDPYDFVYSEFIGDSDGLVRHYDYGGKITGIPTSDTTVEVTWMDLSTEEAHVGSFTIHVVPITTTTQFLQSYMYVVEGTTSQIRLIGTVSDGSTYRADVSADGGSLSTDNVSSGQLFYYTAPMVDGTETFYVTASSSVPGTQPSYDV